MTPNKMKINVLGKAIPDKMDSANPKKDVDIELKYYKLHENTFEAGYKRAMEIRDDEELRR